MMRNISLPGMMLVVGLLLLPSAHGEEIRQRDGDLTLNARLHKAGDSWPQGPAVLITHGTLAHNGMEIVTALQELLSEHSVSSLAINLSLGIDDRHGMYPCKTPHRHKHTDALDEIDSWVKWLQRQGATQVVLMGHSRGGNQTAWYAAERAAPPVDRLILIAPATWDADRQEQEYLQRFGKPLAPIRDRAKKLVDRGETLSMLEPVDFIYCQDTSASAEAMVDYYAVEPRMDTPRLLSEIRLPVLVFAGSEDRVVSGLAEAMAPLIDNDQIRLEVLEGADHFFRDLYLEDLVDISVEFIDQQ